MHACSQVMTVFDYQIGAEYLRGVSQIAALECSFVASSVCVLEGKRRREEKKGRERDRRLVRTSTGTLFLFFLAYFVLEAVSAVLHELL